MHLRFRASSRRTISLGPIAPLFGSHLYPRLDPLHPFHHHTTPGIESAFHHPLVALPLHSPNVPGFYFVFCPHDIDEGALDPLLDRLLRNQHDIGTLGADHVHPHE